MSASLFEAIFAGDDARALDLVAGDRELAAARNENGVSAPLWALYNGRADLAGRLAEARGELDVFEASALGSMERLRQLLGGDPGAPSCRSSDGFTPLHYAAFFGQEESAKLLIEHGADLEARSTNEQFALDASPLHSAVAARRQALCRVLLAAGADVNAVQHGGYTPLLEAAQLGDAELAGLLLEHGADPSARLDDGRGAAELAREAGEPGLAATLEAAAAA